jgi:tetratricopeptide (TPR) repeat protein
MGTGGAGGDEDLRVTAVVGPSPSHFRALWVGGAFLVVVGCLAYAPLWSNEFISYDDPDYLTNNAQVARGLTWETWCWAWTSYEVANWHPVTWLSHLLDVEIFGSVSARVTHVENLGWHLASTLLLLLMLTNCTGRFWPSLLAASLFLLHPMNVESVAWGAQRKGVLSTFLGLASIGTYGLYVKRQGSWRKGIWYAASVLLASMSLMAKPTWVPIPIFLLLVDYWPLRRWDRSKAAWKSGGWILDKVPYAIMSLIECWITLQAQTVATASESALPWSVRFLTALSSYIRYLEMMFWPVNLGVLYPHPLAAPSWGRLGMGLVLVLGLTCCFCRWRKWEPALWVGWLAYLVALVPTIGYVQVGLQSVADRYGYVSFIGIFVGLSFAWFNGVLRLGGAERSSAGLIVVLWGLLGGLTYLQSARWNDSVTLFAHTAQVTNNNFIAYSHLARAFLDRGDLDRAEYFSERAVESGWRDPLALVSLASFRARQGRVAEAEELAREAVGRNPRCVPAYITLAELSLVRRDRASARKWIAMGLAIDPDNVEGGRVLDELNR